MMEGVGVLITNVCSALLFMYAGSLPEVRAWPVAWGGFVVFLNVAAWGLVYGWLT